MCVNIRNQSFVWERAFRYGQHKNLQYHFSVDFPATPALLSRLMAGWHSHIFKAHLTTFRLLWTLRVRCIYNSAVTSYSPQKFHTDELYKILKFCINLPICASRLTANTIALNEERATRPATRWGNRTIAPPEIFKTFRKHLKLF